MMTPLLDTSLPLRECGLKYHKDMLPRIGCPVTPLAGVWIEICLARVTANKSLVTPLAGVWIEIPKSLSLYPSFRVTPLAGVWIEIIRQIILIVVGMSLPLQECGLKFF